MQTPIKALFLLVLFILNGIFSFGQSQKIDSLSTVIHEIAESNVYEVSYTIGYAGTISKQFERFEQLVSLATEEQLLDIAARNDNAIVRLYAYQALQQKTVEIPGTLIQQFQRDNTIVKMLDGCFGEMKSVKALFNKKLKFPRTF